LVVQRDSGAFRLGPNLQLCLGGIIKKYEKPKYLTLRSSFKISFDI
jgi:hypothetical protein